MIHFPCECGEQLQAAEENAGRQTVCPACGRTQIIPAVGEDAIQPGEAARAPAAASQRVRRGRPALASESEDVSPAVAASGTSGKATISLVLGILSLFCNFLAGLPAVLFGLLALREIGRSRGRLSGQGLAIAGIAVAGAGTLLSCLMYVPISIGLLLPAVQKTREAAARVHSQNNLKQVSLAMHNYHATYGHFPSAAICDPAGKPLLSWRVAILPFVEEEVLYRQFKLDEPWDGPTNLKLLVRMPKVYQFANDIMTPADQTHYQVFVGNGAAFEKTRALRMPQDFPDGTGNIIMIIEAQRAVQWTKPDDLPFHPNQPLPPLGGQFPNGYIAAGMDGGVHFIPNSTPEQTLRLLIQRNDGLGVTFP